jgi:rubrerythrin
MVEQIEDEINAELTPTHRTEFFKLLEKMSPKDASGNIVEYADHFAVWDIYQEKMKKPVNPAKEISARAMVQGGSASASNLNNDSHEAWLRQQGIL